MAKSISKSITFAIIILSLVVVSQVRFLLVEVETTRSTINGKFAFPVTFSVGLFININFHFFISKLTPLNVLFYLLDKGQARLINGNDGIDDVKECWAKILPPREKVTNYTIEVVSSI